VFHERRVLPLMRWAHRLDEMVPNAPLEGTMLVMGELDREEIKKHIKSALGSVPPDAALDVHPPMHPNDGFVKMVSAPHSSSPHLSLGFFVFLFA
jgi:predicted Zn-dependent peptidase